MIISCYQPPNSIVDQFFDDFSYLIKQLDGEDKELCILGDHWQSPVYSERSNPRCIDALFGVTGISG